MPRPGIGEPRRHDAVLDDEGDRGGDVSRCLVRLERERSGAGRPVARLAVPLEEREGRKSLSGGGEQDRPRTERDGLGSSTPGVMSAGGRHSPTSRHHPWRISFVVLVCMSRGHSCSGSHTRFLTSATPNGDSSSHGSLYPQSFFNFLLPLPASRSHAAMPSFSSRHSPRLGRSSYPFQSVGHPRLRGRLIRDRFVRQGVLETGWRSQRPGEEHGPGGAREHRLALDGSGAAATDQRRSRERTRALRKPRATSSGSGASKSR